MSSCQMSSFSSACSGFEDFVQLMITEVNIVAFTVPPLIGMEAQPTMDTHTLESRILVPFKTGTVRF